MEWRYEMQRRVRETATYLTRAGDGELVQYLVRLCELPGGRWLVHLMALPWDSARVSEQTFATVGQACEAADALYAKGLDSGRWDVRRYGWQRPAVTRSGSGTPPTHPRGR